MSKYFYASLTRISDLAEKGFELDRLPREEWDEADYVVGRVMSRAGELSRVELRSGRMIEVVKGDLVVGALGTRTATLEAVGDWRRIGEDGVFHSLTSAGLFGKATSVAPHLPPLMRLEYQGHVSRNGKHLSMKDFVSQVVETAFDIPTVLIVGTSMSAGKTTSAKRIVRHLENRGLRITGAKLTGAGRFRDVLAMWDAGASKIYDFVDVGYPSTAVDPVEFRERLRVLLSMIASDKPDVVVVEAGASPLEPYNGEVVVDELRSSVRCTVLCASDPYAVVGVMQAFDLVPDVIAGIATNTSAAIELIHELTGQGAFSFLDPEDSVDAFSVIDERLGI